MFQEYNSSRLLQPAGPTVPCEKEIIIVMYVLMNRFAYSTVMSWRIKAKYRYTEWNIIYKMCMKDIKRSSINYSIKVYFIEMSYGICQE